MPFDTDKPITTWSQEELSEYLDSHLVMVLNAADHLHGVFEHPEFRQQAEDYVRDHLVAISDTWTDAVSLDAERHRQGIERLRHAIYGKDAPQPKPTLNERVAALIDPEED